MSEGLAALAVLGAAALLALSGLKDQAAFFYAPSDAQRELPPPDQSPPSSRTRCST